MNDDQSKSAVIQDPEVQDIGKNKVIVTKPLFSYVPDKEPSDGGRKSIFESQRVMALLESAYKIGATHAEAALFAGLASISPIKYHITKKTPLRIVDRDGKDTGERVTFPELIELWQGNLTLTAKNKIYTAVAAKDTNTTDSWRVLERRQAGEWGLKAGVGSVDGAGGMNVEVDLLAEGMQRAGKFIEDPAGDNVTGAPKEVEPPPPESVPVPETATAAQQ